MWSQGLWRACEVQDDFAEMRQLVCQRVVEAHLWPPLFFSKLVICHPTHSLRILHTSQHCPPSHKKISLHVLYFFQWQGGGLGSMKSPPKIYRWHIFQFQSQHKISAISVFFLKAVAEVGQTHPPTWWDPQMKSKPCLFLALVLHPRGRGD